jgi:Cu(I)/Ag(I) efflux system membrane fusion protein
VIRLGDQDRVVLALGEGRFKSVAVALGRIDGAFAEIRGGLSVGERVVTSAHFLLDSESSKTSDFKRMNHASMKDKTMNHSTMNHSTMKNEPSKGHEMENDND